jgi:hypothetical protein
MNSYRSTGASLSPASPILDEVAPWGAMTENAREITRAVDRVVRLFVERQPTVVETARLTARPLLPAESSRRFREPLLPMASAGHAATATGAPQLGTRTKGGDRGDRPSYREVRLASGAPEQERCARRDGGTPTLRTSAL